MLKNSETGQRGLLSVYSRKICKKKLAQNLRGKLIGSSETFAQ